MEFFDSSKSVVENLSLLSSILVALLGAVAIFQLKLTKAAIITASRREAAKLAADQIDTYNNKIIPLQNKVYHQCVNEKISEINIEIGEFNREHIIGLIGETKMAELVVERLTLTSNLLAALNAMEAFSTYFVKGVADEEIAYSAVGYTFCHVVEAYYFDIATCFKKGEETAFKNIISLYEIWSKRCKKETLSKNAEAIKTQLDGIKAQKINPIGTK